MSWRVLRRIATTAGIVPLNFAPSVAANIEIANVARKKKEARLWLTPKQNPAEAGYA